MCTKLYIVAVIFLFTHALEAQEHEWTQVNGWRYVDIHVANHFEDDIYFFDRCANELLFLDEELGIDSSVYFGEEYIISRFIKFDEISFALASKDYQSFIFRYDKDYNVLDQDLVQFSLIGIYRMRDKLLLVKSEGDQTIYSFIEPSTGNELFSFKSESKLQFDGVKILDDLSYLNFGHKVLVVNESIGVVDSFEMNFQINDVEIHPDNSISVAGNSKFIYILSKDDYSKIDSIETVGLQIPILPDEVYSHKYIDGRIYVSTTFKMEYSDDNGVTWSTMGFAKDQFIRNNVYFDFSNDKYLFWLSQFGIEGFDKESKTITQFNAIKVNEFNFPTYVNDSTLVAVNVSANSTYREIWKSIDFGASWYKALEWDVGDFFDRDLSYDVNTSNEAIHYSPVDSLVYYSSYFGEDWQTIDSEKLDYVSDLFISNEGNAGVVLSDAILLREKGGNEWEVEFSFESDVYRFSIVDNPVNNWIIGWHEVDSSLLILQYSDEFGLSEPIVIESIEPKFFYGLPATNADGDLFVNTGEEFIRVDADNTDLTYICQNLDNYWILNYQNEDTMLIVKNDSLFITSNGCAESGISLFSGLGKDSYWFSRGGFSVFNGKNEGFYFSDRAFWVYRNPLDDDYIPTAVEDTDRITDVQWIDVFPNPTDGRLYFHGGLDIRSYAIYSIDGVLVKSMETSQVNITDLSSGTYFLVVDTSVGFKYSKVVKL